MDLCLHIGCFCLAWQQALGLEKYWLAVRTGIAGVVYRHLKMFASQGGSWSTVMESEHQQPVLAGTCMLECKRERGESTVGKCNK